MTGIYNYKHTIELQDRDMAKVFDRIERDIKIRSIEDTEQGTVLVNYTTLHEIELQDRVSILTFAGRPLKSGELVGIAKFNQ